MTVGYIGRRLLWALVILWCVCTLTFVATALSPVDAARAFAGERAGTQAVEQTRESLGLNRSFGERYIDFLERTLRGDLGTSYLYQEPVLNTVLDRAGATVKLALCAVFLELLIGIPLGVVAALRRGGMIDRFLLSVSLVCAVVPSFVLGFLLLYFLAFRLGWFPLGGNDSPTAIILPALTLAIPYSAWYARMVRSTMLNIANEDYIKVARSKGLSEWLILRRHVMRNALAPIVVMTALDFGAFLGGVLIIERVFAWPGVGQQAWRAIESNDIPLVIGTVLLATLATVLANLTADFVNVALDPRVRHS